MSESISDLASQIISEAGQTPTAPAGAAGSPDVSEQALNDMGISQDAVDSFILEAVEAAPDCAGVVKETTSAGSLGVNMAGGEPKPEKKKFNHEAATRKALRDSDGTTVGNATFSTVRTDARKKKAIYEALSVKKKKKVTYKVK